MPNEYPFGGMVGPTIRRGGDFYGTFANNAGKKPSAPVDLKQAVSDLSVERESYQPYKQNYLSSLANQADRGIADLNRTAGMQRALAGRALPPTFGGALGQSLRIAKARQGIMNRGEAAIRNQQLKDRLRVASLQQSKRGQLIDAHQRAANIKEGVNAGISSANNMAKAARYEMFGNIAGAGAVLGKMWWDNRPIGEIDTSGFPQKRLSAEQELGISSGGYGNWGP